MDRVHSRSQRRSPCKERQRPWYQRDNTMLRPANNDGVCNTDAGVLYTVNERCCEREWTRSISNRHDRHKKLNMFNFSDV